RFLRDVVGDALGIPAVFGISRTDELDVDLRGHDADEIAERTFDGFGAIGNELAEPILAFRAAARFAGRAQLPQQTTGTGYAQGPPNVHDGYTARAASPPAHVLPHSAAFACSERACSVNGEESDPESYLRTIAR